MENQPSLAFKISRDFSHLYCELHHLGISTKTVKETTLVKVCCSYFKSEVEKTLQKRFGNNLVAENIKFQLPLNEYTATGETGAGPDE